MKTTKRIAAIVLALVMAFTLAVPSFAADPTYELFIKNAAAGHIYDAYQIFAGDLSADQTTLSNIEWGSSVKDKAADLITALTTDTYEIKLANNQTTTLADVFISLTTTTNENLPIEKKAALVADVLGTVSNDSATLDRFAEVVGEVVYDADGKFESHKYLGAPVSSIDKQSTKEIDEKDADGNDVKVTYTGYNIPDLPAGYYLIKDRDNSQLEENEGDFYTKYIVRVVKSDNINVKGEGVRVSKTVNDTLGGTYTKNEEAYVNQKIYFKWEGTLPSNLSSYDSYNYKFTDSMSTGLTFIRFEEIYIENSNGSIAQQIFKQSSEDSNDAMPNGITITNPVLDAEGKNNIFTLEFENLLNTYSSLLPSQKVIVKYSAYLNRGAVMDGANPNTVVLEYSNNPNGEGIGKTVLDEAYAFTFDIHIDKYDAANTTTKLEGVEFYLYYQDGEGNSVTQHYAKVVTEEMVDKEIINGKVVTDNDVGLVYGYTTNRQEASVLDTDVNGSIHLKGLDSGIYYLEEIKTNDGYNLLDTPVQFEIITNFKSDNQVEISYKVDGMDQKTNAVVGIRNSKGSTLPSTGGMGTTIFYIVGGLLVAGAVVTLVTKKRMSDK